MLFYCEGYVDGGFEIGIEMVLCVLFASLEFLFWVEWDFDDVFMGTLYCVTDFELVMWLFFFLWSSLLDDELFEVVFVNWL